jgi:5-oxoprolinase (ATP-hydrolysing) subunit C
MTRLIIQTCGPSTSLQDHGRFGWQKYGLGPAGAMDRLAQAEANALVGNVAGAGVIELAIAGMRFTIEDGAARIALAGAEQKLTVDGVAVPPAAAVTVQAGQVVDISGVKVGRFGYLAVAGGFDVPLQLGALAYHSRALMGGFNGRTLQAGDALALRLPTPPSRPDLMAPGGFVRRPKGRLRVVAGPQDDYFGEAGWGTFLGEAYTITANADRMGLRLTGPAIAHNARGYNIVSDGIVTGSIQVPGSGEPLILLADRQTTGGYPKIATVITADLPRLAQSGPGCQLRFERVTRHEAIAALRAQQAAIEAFKASLKAQGASALDSAQLLSASLIDGWVSATDWHD